MLKGLEPPEGFMGKVAIAFLFLLVLFAILGAAGQIKLPGCVTDGIFECLKIPFNPSKYS